MLREAGRWFGCAVLLLSYVPSKADGLNDVIDTTLSFRSDVWSGSRELDNAAGIEQVSAWGQAKANLDTFGTVFGSGWLRDQSSDDPKNPHALTRELYWRYDIGPVDLKIGRQIVEWGRADGINPTDNLSPRNFTLLAPEDADQRYGNEAIQLSVSTGIGNLIGLWYPHAASDTIPLIPLPNVNYEVSQPQQSQRAIKWDASGDSIDGSLSYFDGVDPMPDLQIGRLDSSGLTISVRNHPAQIFGGDFSVSKGSIVWRGEAAWMQTESTGPDDFTHKKPQLFMVGGGELTLGESTTLGLQAVFQYVKDFENPDSITQPVLREIAWSQAATSNQTSATQSGLTLRLASRWLNDTLMAETSGVMMRPTGSGIWRTKISFAIDDRLTVQTGTDYFFGPAHSFFGQLDKNRLVYGQLRYSL